MDFGSSIRVGIIISDPPGELAHLVEHCFCTAGVTGSSPVFSISKYLKEFLSIMAFTPRTDHKESLQALAMSLRQSKGSDLESIELAQVMQALGTISPEVKKYCIIEYSKMQRDFNI